MPEAIIAFDLDRTLTVRDCMQPFLAHVAGPLALHRSLLRQPLRALLAAAERQRAAIKEIALTGSLRGRDQDEICRAGERFADIVCERWLRADTVSLLRHHQRLDHRVVVVTASLGVYARPIGKRLGVDGVLATELESDDRGSLTGRLEGPNCRGPVKVARLRDWAIDNGLHGAPLVHAYGDSAGDDEMLAAAENPHRVSGHGWRR